jgi:hypothetical protein
MRRARAPLRRGLASLEAERRRLLAELGRIGPFRRGSISVNRRRCGKPACACRRTDHPGHGPQFLLTTRIDGRSRSRSLRPGGELRRVREQVANHRRFRALVAKLVEISERICIAGEDAGCLTHAAGPRPYRSVGSAAVPERAPHHYGRGADVKKSPERS